VNPGFREQIRRNGWRLRLLLAAIALATVAGGRIAGRALEGGVGAGTGGAAWDRPSPPWYADYPNQVAAALLLLVFVHYLRIRRGGGRILLGLSGATPLGERRFRNAAQEMAIAAGIGTPSLHVVEDPSLNAFAVESRDGSSIVVTRGLVDRLDRGALQAVVAHETAHLANGDAKLMTVLLGLSRVFAMTAAFALGPLGAIWAGARPLGPPSPLRIRLPGGGRKDIPAWWLPLIPVAALLLAAVALVLSAGLFLAFALLVRHLPLVALALAVFEIVRGDRKFGQGASRALWFAPVGLVAGPAILLLGCLLPLFALLARLAVSRNREFQADATAVALTRDPDSLVRALECLRDDPSPPAALPASLAPLAIRPFGGLARLLSTHPSLDARIGRVRAMAATGSRRLRGAPRPVAAGPEGVRSAARGRRA
jgi:Zn-dependent protease with chaperone function